MINVRPLFFLVLGSLASVQMTASTPADSVDGNRWTTNFSLQSDWHLANKSQEGTNRLSSISYLDGVLRNKFLEFGARLEYKQYPLPGREEEKGWGLPYFYARGRYRGFDLTLGDFYEQFGSGLLFRAYEDRFLGLDNAVRGALLRYSHHDLLRFKALVGQPRNSFDRGARLFSSERGFVAGGDLEFSLENLRMLSSLKERGGTLQLGAGFLSKQEDPNELASLRGGAISCLRQPRTTASWAMRGVFSLPAFNVNAEYSHKDYDPNRTNGFIFRPGSVALLTATYLWGKSSLFVGARRSENFDFRSSRLAEGNALRLNFLQPFTKQQTYSLAAFYPYATQPNGEWAFQGAFDTSISDGSGKEKRRKTNLKIYGSLAMGLRKHWVRSEGETNPLAPELMGTDGYTTDFFGMKDLLFREIGVEVSRKVSQNYSFVLGYTHQDYNQRLLQGHAANGDIIHSHIFLYEGRHRLSTQLTLRTELQYFLSRQDSGDWCYGSVEYSILPHFILSASDLWNVSHAREHYYMFSASGSWTHHNVRLSYGRTCAGVNCSGGICRYLPETNGLTLSYLLNL